MSNIHIFLLLITPFYPVLATPPRHCTCVHFNSTGTFHSPNYPNQITNIDCVFYHFEGPEDHLVQIVFHGFFFPPRHERCEQSLRIYDHSRDGMIGIHQNPDFEFCGKEIAPGHVFYSRDNHFILQILHSQASSKGFMGEYRFLPKKNFSSDAVQLSEYSYRVEKAKGTLYSPSYPYFYPTRVNATFIVPQRKGHQVVLSSSELLLGDEAVLYVFDMTNGETLLQTVTSTSHKFFCTSSSPLLLSFVAGHNEVERARGLVIEFLYEPARWPLAADPQVDGECLVTITSEREKSGNFSSKKWNWKGGSNLPTKCRLLFQGFPGERVSVKFVYFNLYVPDNKNVTERCGDVDSLTADVRVGSRLSRVAEWCANQLPPPLMSNTNLLQIEYTTKSSRAVRDSARLEHGFALEYLFHNDWNMKHMQAKVDTNKACRFIFNSSLQSSGKLWSVNYPGFYPRNLYCEYIFHGSEDQIVHIHFEYFDVEGFNQCDETTQSDFVLFSNYQTHDRTNRRFCGKVAPRGPILSESNYFRMIFFTNDIFDATGFYAHYQFITQQKAQISRVKLTTTSVCDPLSWNFSYLLFLVSLIL